MTNLEKLYAAAEGARERAQDAHRDQAINESGCNLAWLAAETAFADAVKLQGYAAESALKNALIGPSISMACFRLAQKMAERRQTYMKERTLPQAA